MKKICKHCNKLYGVKNIFCPICGEKLSVVCNFDVKKFFEPYLKGTRFFLEPGNNCYYFEFRYDYNGSSSIEKDTKKLIKRLAKEKPEFLTVKVFVINDFGTIKLCVKIKMAIVEEKRGEEINYNYLYTPYDKGVINSLLLLLNKEDFSELVTNCQRQIDHEESYLKETVKVLKQYKDLKKRLSLKEEEWLWE